MHALKEELNQKYPQLPVFYFEKEKNKLIDAVKQNLEATDSIMLKGSNSMGLFEVVEQLQQMK